LKKNASALRLLLSGGASRSPFFLTRHNSVKQVAASARRWSGAPQLFVFQKTVNTERVVGADVEHDCFALCQKHKRVCETNALQFAARSVFSIKFANGTTATIAFRVRTRTLLRIAHWCERVSFFLKKFFIDFLFA